MGYHHDTDYKLHAVKHYLKNQNKDSILLWHGLLRSTNVPNSNSNAKHILYDRDLNGSMNIRKIFCNHLDDKTNIRMFFQEKNKKNNSSGLHWQLSMR